MMHSVVIFPIRNDHFLNMSFVQKLPAFRCIVLPAKSISIDVAYEKF